MIFIKQGRYKRFLFLSSLLFFVVIGIVLVDRQSRKIADHVISEVLTKILINKQDFQLPYDNTNPIIYDNDAVDDVYTDDYLMALASAGDINLVGMITSSSVSPYNKHVTSSGYEKGVPQRAEGVKYARNSGFRNIPDPVRGTKGHLHKPSSGKIEDTEPIGSEGSWLIVEEARKANPDKPLVLVMGGPLTVAADAYLLDNSVAEKIVVAWLGGRENDMADYNGWADHWAAYIVLQRFRLVQFPAWEIGGLAAPSVPKDRLTELPNTELSKWMIAKQHPNGLPAEREADAPPAISLMQTDYVKEKIVRVRKFKFRRFEVKRVSFSHWIVESDREQPAFKEDPKGRAFVVTYADKDVAPEEWWRALRNPAAYSAIHK